MPGSGADQEQRDGDFLLAKLSAAAAARAREKCATAANNYQAFLHELEAQSGEGSPCLGGDHHDR